MLVDCGIYRDGARRDDGHLSIEDAARVARADDGGFVWIGLHDPEPGELEKLARLFGLHELAVEDAHRAHQRPKIEDYDDGFFIVLRTGHYHQAAEEVHFGEIHIFTGPGYVISVRHGPGSELSTARARLEARPDLLRLGPAAAVWAVVD